MKSTAFDMPDLCRALHDVACGELGGIVRPVATATGFVILGASVGEGLPQRLVCLSIPYLIEALLEEVTENGLTFEIPARHGAPPRDLA